VCEVPRGSDAGTDARPLLCRRCASALTATPRPRNNPVRGSGSCLIGTCEASTSAPFAIRMLLVVPRLTSISGGSPAPSMTWKTSDVRKTFVPEAGARTTPSRRVATSSMFTWLNPGGLSLPGHSTQGSRARSTEAASPREHPSTRAADRAQRRGRVSPARCRGARDSQATWSSTGSQKRWQHPTGGDLKSKHWPEQSLSYLIFSTPLETSPVPRRRPRSDRNHARGLRPNWVWCGSEATQVPKQPASRARARCALHRLTF
jgi:hypothetical protein